jgi:hypothetical protein
VKTSQGGIMSIDQKSMLETELGELFDIRKTRRRMEMREDQDIMETKNEIKLLIRMFSDGIPSMTVQIADHETLEWDNRVKKLLYQKNEYAQYIDTANKMTLLRIRPFLKELVKKAKNLYR